MKNEIVKIESTELEKVVTESGLAIQEGEDIKKSYLPFLSQLAEIQSQATKINFETPAEIDETIARELRLKTVKIRTSSKDLKDERKRGYLLRGNLEQAAYNLIEASCKLTEDVFVNVEKAREFAEKKRKEQLRIERSEKLASYVAVETIVMYPLAEMSDEQFNQLYDGLKLAAELKIEADKKAEEKRLADIEAERVKNENIRLENERLKKEAESKEKALQSERENAAKILAEQKAKDAAKIEREILYQKQIVKDAEFKANKVKEESERQAEIERKKQAQILADQKAKAVKEQADLMAKNQANIERADKERKEKEVLLADIEAKKQADLKVKQAEQKAKLQADKKAQLAPDKTKLLAFGQALNNVPRPDIKNIEAAGIMANVNGLLAKVNQYILDNASKL